MLNTILKLGMKNNIRSLALIADNYPSKGNMSLVFVQQLVEQFVDLGVDVTVIAPQSLTKCIVRGEKLRPKDTEVTTKKGNSYKVCRPYFVSTGNHLNCIKGVVDYLRKREILKILKHINPDVIYGHFWHNLLPVYQYANNRNIPLFVACGEGDNALEELIKYISSDDKLLLATTVTGVISVSSENKRKCIEFGLAKADNIVVLPNCVNADIFYPHTDLNKRRELGVKDADFLIVFVGGFIHRKGSARLAAAIDKLDRNDIKVVFIGKPMGGDNADPVCKGIIYKGALSHDEIPSYLSCANVFVLPTLKEGCSNAIVEALAMGVPVISSDGPFNDDILNEYNSVRINPMDVDAIASAIMKMKTDKEFYQSCRQYLKDNENNYSIKTRAVKILEFMHNQMNL